MPHYTDERTLAVAGQESGFWGSMSPPVEALPPEAAHAMKAAYGQPEIRAQDKQKTVVILTGGILEQHGPHLPSYTDTYVNEWLTERLAEAIVKRPGWAVLVFPRSRSDSELRT